MVPPFLLALKDSQEVRLFRNLTQLESSIEAVDVLQGEYEAFDAVGRRIKLIVDEYGAPRAEPGTADQEAARALILEYYTAANPSFRPTMTLDELVKSLSDLYGYDKGSSSSS